LYRSDFFYVAGKDKKFDYPYGRDLMSFDERYIGGFSNRNIRPEHKIRSYSIDDNPYVKGVYYSESISVEEKRDYLIEYFSYKVYEHFEVLLQEVTSEFASLYVDILSELITNGIMHSGTDVFALMFSDKYAIKFSISDNGVGLYNSIEKKKGDDNKYYKKFELSDLIFEKSKLKSNLLTKSLVVIFETLFYSMVKKRLGVFDLMVNVVNHFSGYFRLHNECSQVIFSSRLSNELEQLEQTRNEIRNLYFMKEFKQIKETEFDIQMKQKVLEGKYLLLKLFQNTLKKYSDDVRFSAIRTYNVLFNGVHIEVEIPKQ
jgi:hypothetical protein